uniref:2-Hacid_dh_C domain-containing protein n=1 Tax=Steinernema glaseri TaxID=37863 RepID=A0A1I7ZPF3_9BILA
MPVLNIAKHHGSSQCSPSALCLRRLLHLLPALHRPGRRDVDDDAEIDLKGLPTPDKVITANSVEEIPSIIAKMDAYAMVSTFSAEKAKKMVFLITF